MVLLLLPFLFFSLPMEAYSRREFLEQIKYDNKTVSDLKIKIRDDSPVISYDISFTLLRDLSYDTKVESQKAIRANPKNFGAKKTFDLCSFIKNFGDIKQKTGEVTKCPWIKGSYAFTISRRSEDLTDIPESKIKLVVKSNNKEIAEIIWAYI